MRTQAEIEQINRDQGVTLNVLQAAHEKTRTESHKLFEEIRQLKELAANSKDTSPELKAAIASMSKVSDNLKEHIGQSKAPELPTSLPTSAQVLSGQAKKHDKDDDEESEKEHKPKAAHTSHSTAHKRH